MDRSRQFLKDICESIGPSGYEQDTARLWRDYLKDIAELDSDVNGNMIAILNKGAEYKVMLAGHIDEIGFMVRYIDKDGFLYFSPIGGIDPSLVLGQRVKIKGAGGEVAGVVGRKPIHLMERDELGKAVKWENLYIDIGVSSKAEAETMVMIGDVAVPWVEFWEIGKDRIVSKALDDRAGAYVVARVIELLSERKDELNVAVFGVATVQEEIGLRGAKTSSYQINPQVGIAIDVTFATDYPLIEKKKTGEIRLGAGPVIARGPNINPKLFNKLVSIAEDKGITYQIEGIPRATGTDANSIQITRSGICTGLVSVPLRYMHSPVEMASFSDLEATAILLAEFILSLTGQEDWRVC